MLQVKTGVGRVGHQAPSSGGALASALASPIKIMLNDRFDQSGRVDPFKFKADPAVRELTIEGTLLVSLCGQPLPQSVGRGLQALSVEHH